MPRAPQGFLQDRAPEGWTKVDNKINEGEIRPIQDAILEVNSLDDLINSASRVGVPSSLRATRRLQKEKESSLSTARDLLLSSLLSISAVPISSFPKDEQKTALVTLKEITERIRSLRNRLS